MDANSVKTSFKILTLTIGLSILSSCAEESLKENITMAPAEVSDAYETIADNKNYDSKPNTTTGEIPKNLKIIKSATARYKVNNVKTATQEIKKMALEFDAYISDMRFENDLYRIENRFTIKIPQQHFDIMMDSASSVVEFVDYENITTEDVTEKYIDLQTRLKTKLEVKERYETILRKNAKTVEDILATEDKLRIIQEEIEAAQGKLKYLTNKVAYSTIQIDLYETVDYKEEPTAYVKTFWSKSKDGLTFGWKLIESILLGVIYLWPLIILGTLIFIFARKRLKKKRQKRQQ